MKKFFILTALLPLTSLAQVTTVNHIPRKAEKISHITQPQQRIEPVIVTQQTQPIESISLAQIQHNPVLAEQILNLAIQQRRYDIVAEVLPIYRTFSTQDRLLVLFAQGILAKSQQHNEEAVDYFRQILALNPRLNTVRIELAITLFNAQQDVAATEQFQKAKAEPNVPPQIVNMIDRYLSVLKQRASWQTSFSVNYLRERNVNNTSSDRNIENTGFIKSDTMLPQSANGIQYSVGIERDINIVNAHYLHIENMLWGKFYWDKQDYNDVLNRTYLGYINKSALQTWKILPFYERRWLGNARYQWANGVRGELHYWLSPHWQWSAAIEYAKQHYFNHPSLNGHNQLYSSTLVWIPNSRQYFSLGTDFNREKTAVKQYSSDSKTLRLGWGQEWNSGISSRLNLSISEKHFKDKAKLGGFLPLNKVRSDLIYTLNLTLWKRDWHVWHITPKLNLSWKKQTSTIPSMYSYSDKNISIIFETSF